MRMMEEMRRMRVRAIEATRTQTRRLLQRHGASHSRWSGYLQRGCHSTEREDFEILGIQTGRSRLHATAPNWKEAWDGDYLAFSIDFQVRSHPTCRLWAFTLKCDNSNRILDVHVALSLLVIARGFLLQFFTRMFTEKRLYGNDSSRNRLHGKQY